MRKSWRLQTGSDTLIIVNRSDLGKDEKPSVVPLLLVMRLDRWLADPLSRKTVFDMYESIGGPSSRSGRAGPALTRSVKMQMQRAFQREDFVALRAAAPVALAGSVVAGAPPIPKPQPPSSPASAPVKPTPLLKIIQVDDHFAPSAEFLNIQYEIFALSGEVVKLKIEAENYSGKTVFERELTATEKADGKGKLLTWIGKVTAGSRKERHATPLMGPYKVKLFQGASLKDEKPFKILYHSIALGWGKHTPDGLLPPTTDKKKYAQARLNELGYDSGPVDGFFGKISEKALKRFQRANYEVGTQKLLKVDGILGNKSFTAIQNATARELWESGKNPLTADAKFYVYDNFMNDPEMNFVTGNTPEFNSADRKKHAEEKMERPYLPLEVEIKLLNKANNGVSAPDAVGEVPVAWEVSDAVEDAAVIPSAGNAAARTYVRHAREIGATAVTAGAARIDQDGDNALDIFDGFRKSAAADYIQSCFPTKSSALKPYSIDQYDKEMRGTTDFFRAIVKAWDHPKDHPRCKGRAGAYFRFSTKGGDDAKIRVSLSFGGLPNKDQLEKDHSKAPANLVKETGRWTVWRRTRVSAYCTQVAAPPRPSGLPNWTTIRDRWKEAFIEVENTGNPAKIITYSAVVTEAVYKAAVLAMPASHRPPGATAASLTYRAGSMYGGPTLTQSPGETAAAYINRAQTAMAAWTVNPINAILKVISDEARKTSPEGFVIFDFRIHEPITGRDWNPLLNAGAGGFQPSADPSVQNQIGSASGYVRCAGAVTMNVDNPFNVNCYLSHECGHARFLYHHETMNGGVSDNPTHHDADQRRCTMSYSIGADTPDNWRYPFCGKCILKLRGWTITGLPNRYT